MRIIILFFIIIILFVIIQTNNVELSKVSLIEYKTFYNNYKNTKKDINSHFIIYHIKNRYKIKVSKDIYFIEHNSIYDDILFLVPLYSILVKAKVIMICSDDTYRRRIKKINRIKNFTIYNKCIYFDIDFLKYLQIHSNIFRFCNFKNVYNTLLKNRIEYNTGKYRICKKVNYSYRYSIVTTVYKRNNLKKQIDLYKSQTIPPKSIIVVHDRNFINVHCEEYDIIYFHTINFSAGFYLRYLISILSPENEVIIYDDDWFPYNISSHFNWINKLNLLHYSFFGHHAGYVNKLRWCATPILIHRKWLYLMWFNDIYETRVAEDGHLSFSLILLCNIKCKMEVMNGLMYKEDSLSSSKNIIKTIFWTYYTYNVTKRINSPYIKNTKRNITYIE